LVIWLSNPIPFGYLVITISGRDIATTYSADQDIVLSTETCEITYSNAFGQKIKLIIFTLGRALVISQIFTTLNVDVDMKIRKIFCEYIHFHQHLMPEAPNKV
jgi:hypothetical protein